MISCSQCKFQLQEKTVFSSYSETLILLKKWFRNYTCLIKNNFLMQEQESNTNFWEGRVSSFLSYALELVVFLYTTALDLVEQLVWGSNRHWIQTSSCVHLEQSGVKSCWSTYLIRKPHSSCELPLRGDLRMGLTPPKYRRPLGVTLASGDMVRAVGLGAHPKGGIWNSWLAL